MKILHFFIVAFLISFAAKSQYSPVIAPIRWSKGGFDSLFIPKHNITVTPKDTTRNWITVHNGAIYIWQTSQWNPISGGSTGITTKTLAQIRALPITDTTPYFDSDRGSGLWIYNALNDGIDDDGTRLSNNRVRVKNGPVDIRWFGAKTDGTDNAALFNTLFNNFNSVLIPEGVFTSNANFSVNNPNLMITGSGTITGTSDITFSAAKLIEGIRLEGISILIPYTNTGIEFDRCFFSNPAATCIYAYPGFGTKPKKLRLTNNSFDGYAYAVLGAWDSSYFSKNTYRHSTSRNIEIWAGTGNVIEHEDIDGGITGIAHLTSRSNINAPFNGNRIKNNKLRHISEEAISTDLRGNSSVNSASVTHGTASSIIISSGVNIVPSFTLTGHAFEYLKMYVAPLNGVSKGRLFKITYMGATGAEYLRLENTVSGDMAANDSFAIVVPSFDNEVTGNDIDSSFSGIVQWGVGYNNRITGNVVKNTSNAGISVSSLTGVVAGYFGPSYGNIITGNRLEKAPVVINDHPFSVPVLVRSSGNVFENNTVISSTVTYTHQSELRGINNNMIKSTYVLDTNYVLPAASEKYFGRILTITSAGSDSLVTVLKTGGVYQWITLNRPSGGNLNGAALLAASNTFSGTTNTFNDIAFSNAHKLTIGTSGSLDIPSANIVRLFAVNQAKVQGNGSIALNVNGTDRLITNANETAIYNKLYIQPAGGALETNTASALTVHSTTQGSLPFGRMTASQWAAIVNKPTGLMAYILNNREGIRVNKSTGFARLLDTDDSTAFSTFYSPIAHDIVNNDITTTGNRVITTGDYHFTIQGGNGSTILSSNNGTVNVAGGVDGKVYIVHQNEVRIEAPIVTYQHMAGNGPGDVGVDHNGSIFWKASGSGGGGTVDQTIIPGSTNAISGAAVSTALDEKANLEDIPDEADFSYETLTFSSNISRDYEDLRPNKKIVISGQHTFTYTNLNNGDNGEFLVQQFDGGGWSFSLNGVNAPLDPANNAWTRFGWSYDGTTIRVSSDYKPANATSTEISTGTNTEKPITPSALAGSKYLTQDGAKVSAIAAGTNTYTATITPAITSYSVGQRFYITFINANTGAATLALNGLAAVPIKKNGNVALYASDIKAGQAILVQYDGTNFQAIGLDPSYYYRAVYTNGVTGTIVVTGTTPTGTQNHYYEIVKNGREVKVKVVLNWAVAATSTQVLIPLPADCPAIDLMPNNTDLSHIYGGGLARVSPVGTTITSGTATLFNNRNILVTYGSGSHRTFEATVNYTTTE